mmetsp:Transcript_10346/g.19353  ORF Transcript_10346/g.19353 Transcript_10346/m.19353 type:complete len:364 (+) Transcript_10346:85-1176(+)
MSDNRSRSRSRSPARHDDNGVPSNNNNYGGGDDYHTHDNGGGDSGVQEVKLYVGNLDYDTNENKLREVFSAFGTVTDVFLPTERGTQRPRGFGFVTLAGRPAAEEAIAKMDQAQLDSRTIRVNESRPRGEGADDGRGPGGRGGFNPTGAENVKLYVGNLSFDTTEELVRSHFEKFGEVSDCFLPTDRESGRVRGFAFVTMKAADAEKACIEMNGAEIDGRMLKVNEAQPKGAGGAGGPRGGGGGGYGGYGGGRGGYDRGGYGGGRGGGYDAGYDRGGGYDAAYDRGGYDAGYERGGYERGGYDRSGYDRGGYDRSGYNERPYGGGGRGGYAGGGYNDGYGGGESTDNRFIRTISQCGLYFTTR